MTLISGNFIVAANDLFHFFILIFSLLISGDHKVAVIDPSSAATSESRR
jgi:hypothetical protein